jgi:hypothetical protein
MFTVFEDDSAQPVRSARRKVTKGPVTKGPLAKSRSLRNLTNSAHSGESTGVSRNGRQTEGIFLPKQKVVVYGPSPRARRTSGPTEASPRPKQYAAEEVATPLQHDSGSWNAQHSMRVWNLQQRFAGSPAKVVIEALEHTGGHVGRAARLLRSAAAAAGDLPPENAAPVGMLAGWARKIVDPLYTGHMGKDEAGHELYIETGDNATQVTANGTAKIPVEAGTQVDAEAQVETATQTAEDLVPLSEFKALKVELPQPYAYAQLVCFVCPDRLCCHLRQGEVEALREARRKSRAEAKEVSTLLKSAAVAAQVRT